MIVPTMTSDQLRAATSNRRLCYVKAGPGSGKTFLAAEAFGYLRYMRHQDNPGGVVGVTFARSARRELETRIRIRWGRRSVDWPNSICTFDELHRRLVRYLVHRGLLDWPGGEFPERPEDSWAMHPDATSRPGSKWRYRLTLDENGQIAFGRTKNKAIVPTPAFVDPNKFEDALHAGQCTHTEVRHVLGAALNTRKHPRYNTAIRDCLRGSIAHLIVDEAFDMNRLDCTVLERAIEAGVSMTIVGDPWQSLYEFRGSSPRTVKNLIAGHRFERIDMPGSHRYSSDEMRSLAARLFAGIAFPIKAPVEGEDFDIVLAHDWSALWDETRISILPAGKPSQIDGGLMASTFVMLLNAVVFEHFGIEVSGVGEARRALPITDEEAQLAPAVQLLRDPHTSVADVWAALRSGFQPADSRPWPNPKKRAMQYLERLASLVRAPEPPGKGLTVHQSKGMEWDQVLFLDSELTTDPTMANRLNIDKASHRNVYVGLTRAKKKVRVMRPATKPFGIKQSPIQHVAVPQVS